MTIQIYKTENGYLNYQKEKIFDLKTHYFKSVFLN